MMRLVGIPRRCYASHSNTTTSRVVPQVGRAIGTDNATTREQSFLHSRPIRSNRLLRPTTTAPSQSPCVLQLHTQSCQRPRTSETLHSAFSTKTDDDSGTENLNRDDDGAKIKRDEREEAQKAEDDKLFRETMERLQSSDPSNPDAKDSSEKEDVSERFSTAFQTFSSTLSETWNELLDSSKPRDINKKLTDVHTSRPGRTSDDDVEAAERYKGSTAIMVIDEEDTMSAYDRIQKRLSEAPIIQDVLRRGEEIYETSGAKKATEKLSDIKEDAQETWETSQNPWIYRASSVYETLTAESENGATERELRVLDPTFSLESWKNDVLEVTLPNFMQLFLEGRIKELKPSLGDSVYKRIAAESRVRKKEGVYVDTNVLSIMNLDILSCTPDVVNKGSPIITAHYMCQQINCVRKKKNGEIVEGSEDDIKAYSYVVAFQREYDEEKGELNWKMIDFMMNGAIAYL